MSRDIELRRLVAALKAGIQEGKLNDEFLTHAISELSEIGYRYDADLFPEIKHGAGFSSDLAQAPSNLAEALLWKMGKWRVYKDFVANYRAGSPRFQKTDVVFSAFAKHLKDESNPIYDQHALRAMWAINPNVTPEDASRCRAVLFKSKGKGKDRWKATLSGADTISCYDWYVSELEVISSGRVSKSSLDKLLMPLGQALKTICENYQQFSFVCGINAEGSFSG